MRTLTIRWQRLVDDRGRTCPRCGRTGDNVQRAVDALARKLRPLGIAVRADVHDLTRAAFDRASARSNRIWIAGKPLETWLEAKAGKSRCCGACGPTPCRTLIVGKQSYAAVPTRLIVRAGERAARSLRPRSRPKTNR